MCCAPGNVLLSPLPKLTCSKNVCSNCNYLTKCCNFRGLKKNYEFDYFPPDYIWAFSITSLYTFLKLLPVREYAPMHHPRIKFCGSPLLLKHFRFFPRSIIQNFKKTLILFMISKRVLSNLVNVYLERNITLSFI